LKALCNRCCMEI